MTKQEIEKREIDKLVYERYPITKLEKRGCTIEKAFRDAMRMEYRKKLMLEREPGRKNEIRQ